MAAHGRREGKEEVAADSRVSPERADGGQWRHFAETQ